MPAHAVLLGFLAEQAAALVVKGARNVLTKMPWARDLQRVHTVERKIALLVDRVATLARNVPPESADPLLEPMIQDFREDLLAEKITEGEANQIVESVRAQIRTSVLRPLHDASHIVTRLETVERENVELAKRLTSLEAFRAREESREADRERHARLVQTLAAVAIVLGAIATLVGLVVLARR
ncbi:MAG: hypothetical protein ACO1SV_10195 [Fimbriimonas sp.]